MFADGAWGIASPFRLLLDAEAAQVVVWETRMSAIVSINQDSQDGDRLRSTLHSDMPISIWLDCPKA